MKYEDDLDPVLSDALKVLADADREAGAPPEVEARLRAAFRNKHRRQRMSLWIPLAAAAVILLGVAIEMRMHRSATVAPVIATHQAPMTQAAPTVEPVIAQVTPVQHVAHARPAHKPQEIVTDFFPLAGYAPADEADGAELLRVTLPAAAMREVGLPVREERLADRVQADVLVTHGVAQAVRFVRSE
jgi:hypothetical protein